MCERNRFFIQCEAEAFAKELKENSINFCEQGFSEIARDMFCACLCSARDKCQDKPQSTFHEEHVIGIDDNVVVILVQECIEKNGHVNAQQMAKELLPVIKAHIDNHKYFRLIPDYPTAIRNFMECFFQLLERLEEAEEKVA